MKKALSVLLAVMLLATLLVPLFALPATAAATKETTKRIIAIAFDNSGSMYMPNGNDDSFCYAWCRATYAMEAFATMMNPEDEMYIYPMWPIKVGKKDYTSKSPLKVTQKDANVIEQIYTPTASTTPLSTITNAFNGLSKMKADEKWLVVLTDGDTFNKNESASAWSREESKKNLETELKKCVKKVNVAYLGIGENALMPELKGDKYQSIVKKASDSNQVLGELSAMCNAIFGRKQLADTDKSFSIDVSMNKLIVFIQGKGIDNVKLTNSHSSIEGVEAGDKSAASESKLKYGEKGCGKAYQSDAWKIDNSLQGKLLTFTGDSAPLPAGDYSLSFSGEATSIVYYYEPNVKVALKLLDKEGNEIDPNGKLTEGTYYVEYFLADGLSNQPTESALLGNTEFVIKDGDKEIARTNKAGRTDAITKKSGDKLDISYEVTYLDGYKLEGNAAGLGWPSGGLEFQESIGSLAISLTGGAKEYALSKLEKSETFKVSFTYTPKEGGTAPSQEELNKSLKDNLKVSFDKNVSYSVEQEGTDFIITVKYYEGDPLKTATGRVKMSVSSQYVNKNGGSTDQAAAAAEFAIKDDSRALEMTVIRGESYYQVSEIPNSDPIIIKLSFSGDPLTAEELAAINIDFEPKEAKLVLEKDAANSRVIARLDPKNPPEPDDYSVEITATGKNEVGRAQKVTKKTSFEVGTWPMWAKILVPILIILLLALLIWWWLKQPRLPQRIDMTNVQYVCNGETIPTTGVHATYTGAGKKVGELRVWSPNCPTDTLARQGVTLELHAVTPRRVMKSMQRKAIVNSFRAVGAPYVLELNIRNGNGYVQDPERPGRLVSSRNGQPPAPFEIGHNTPISIVSSTEETSASFSCTLTFK